MTRYIVCCGGSQTKWGNYLGTPSHLVKDKFEETLLHRTVRLLRELDEGDDILVMAPPRDYRYLVEGALTVDGDPSRLNEYWASVPYWDQGGRTVLLLGDVWFSEESLKTISTPREGLCFYGRFSGSKLTGTPWGELFACGFDSADQAFLMNHMEHSLAEYRSLRANRHTGWEILRSVQGQTNLNKHKVNSRWFVEINDLTDDIDFPACYNKHPMFGGSV